MAKKNKASESKLLRTVLSIVIWILTAGVIVFSVFAFMRINDNDAEGASRYLAIIFVLIGLSNLLGHIKNNKGSSIKAILMTVIYIGLGVLVFFAKYNIYIFCISAGIFTLSIIISRVFALVKKHSTRDIILNAILIALAIVLSIGFFQKVDNDIISNVVLLECLFISIYVFIEALIMTLSHLKLTTFASILTRTFALEILLGLGALIVGASLILMNVEPKMNNFADSLWYCFAVVTTIGFGDIVAVTPIGRVVSVFLGIYGIVVVALLTSIIVNFYNETYGKKDASEARKALRDELKK